MTIVIRKPKSLRRNSKDVAIRKALRLKRKVVWKDNEGIWHAATDRRNTPLWAVEVEDVK